MRPARHLLVIDPQNDFCDLPEDRCPPDPATGAERARPRLPVAGAHADMMRLAGLVDRRGDALEAVTVTLDSHHRLDIAHNVFWQTRAGEPVAPFTTIAARDLRAGDVRPRRAEDFDRALRYLDALEAGGRMVHVAWPVHCQIGTWGQALHAGLLAALDRWEDRGARRVAKVAKGENPWTEHYSALQAEVPDPDDPATALNAALLASLAASERVYITGEAGSHCVKETTGHLVAHWDGDPARLVLVRDAMSPVTGFEAVHEDFLGRMAARGLRIATLAEVEAELG